MFEVASQPPLRVRLFGRCAATRHTNVTAAEPGVPRTRAVRPSYRRVREPRFTAPTSPGEISSQRLYAIDSAVNRRSRTRAQIPEFIQLIPEHRPSPDQDARAASRNRSSDSGVVAWAAAHVPRAPSLRPDLARQPIGADRDAANVLREPPRPRWSAASRPAGTHDTASRRAAAGRFPARAKVSRHGEFDIAAGHLPFSFCRRLRNVVRRIDEKPHLATSREPQCDCFAFLQLASIRVWLRANACTTW
jgi:hypothetical protein